MVADNFVSENAINGIELNIRSNHSSVQGNVCGSNKKSGLRIAGSKGISADGNSFRSRFQGMGESEDMRRNLSVLISAVIKAIVLKKMDIQIVST